MSKIGKGIYLRGNIYWLAVQKDGKRSFISLQTSDPAEAIQRSAQARASETIAPATGLAGDVDHWIATRVRQGKFGSKRTQEWARGVGKHLKGYFHGTSTSVSKKDVEEFFIFLKTKMKETSALSYMIGVRAFFAWTMEERIRFDNPAKGIVSKKKRVARLRFATKVQRNKAIREAPSDSLKFILYCAFFAGLRFGEIVEAKPEWFNLAGGFITIPGQDDGWKTKTGQGRTVPLATPFKKFLKKYGLRHPYMLEPDVKHGDWRYRYDFRRPWHEHMVSMGLPWLSPHVARHTFASILVQNGESIFKVAKWCGHSVQVCEQHYAHLVPGDTGIDKLV